MPKSSVPGRLNAAQAAEYLGLSVSTLRLLQRQGRIPHVQISDGKAFYEKDELDRYLESRRVRAQDVKA